MKNVFRNEVNIEGVIHFAAYKAVGESVDFPNKYYLNNVGSLATLSDVMNELGVSNLVFSSSCTVYGEPDHLPVTEETPMKPAESPYGYTKQICEKLLFDNFRSKISNISSVILRYFNPIGAHPSALIGELPLGRPSNLVPFITQVASGKLSKLTIFGDDYNTPDGTCIRDYIHVVDLAKAHVSSLNWLFNSTKKECEVFNIGTGRGNSVLELVKTFEKVNGIKLNYEIGKRRDGDIEKIYADVSKANTILGWKTEKTLEDSLKDAWRW